MVYFSKHFSLHSLSHPVLILHCFFLGINPADYKTIVGDHNRDTNEGTEEIVGAKQIIFHPQYNPSVLNNDIDSTGQFCKAFTANESRICLMTPINDKRAHFDGFNSLAKKNIWIVYDLGVCLSCSLLLIIFCEQNTESLIHLFWDCNFVQTF